MLRVYLDNCCYNRPYDDQSQLKISMEAQAKLEIQQQIRDKKLELTYREDTLDDDALAEVVKSCCLIDEEYQGDSVAFMIENGEKEYSLEVAAIRESEVKVLWRYTVGGNNSVFRCFEPELISINYK